MEKINKKYYYSIQIKLTEAKSEYFRLVNQLNSPSGKNPQVRFAMETKKQSLENEIKDLEEKIKSLKADSSSEECEPQRQ